MTTATINTKASTPFESDELMRLSYPVRDLVFAYFGDLDCTRSFGVCKLIFEEYVLQAKSCEFLSYSISRISQEIPENDYAKRVKALYNHVVDLAKMQELLPSVTDLQQTAAQLSLTSVIQMMKDRDSWMVCEQLRAASNDVTSLIRTTAEVIKDLPPTKKGWAFSTACNVIRPKFLDHAAKYVECTKPNLQTLKLATLPFEISVLPAIKRLHLADNFLTTLPNWTANFNLTSLTLGDNLLIELPDPIARMHELPYLSLNNNRLTKLPDWFGGMKKLISIDLGWNKLTALPDSCVNLQKLRSLDLYDNKISTLPAWLPKLESLTELDVQKNPLDEASKLILDALRARGCTVRA